MAGPDYKGQKKSIIGEAADAIYNMYEDQARKGNLGAGPKAAAEERSFQRGDAVKERRRKGSSKFSI